MAGSVANNSNKRGANLWKEAYNALRDDQKGKERLDKLNSILREQLGKPNLRMRSDDGHKQLEGLINRKSKDLTTKKSSEKIGKICDNMLAIQELVSGGASMAGPFVSIPVAALFLAFSVNQIYRAEKEAMFELAKKVAHYTVLHATSSDRIKILPGDDVHMQDLKKNLHMLYVGLYKSLILACAQLTISLYGDWQFVKQLFKHYDWAGQTQELDDHHQLCKEYRDEMQARLNDPNAKAPKQEVAMGPGPRNPLHWAVAMSVPEQVIHLVQKEEYPINALSPQSWTAAHFAARQGNIKIMKTILTANGVDLRIKNKEGRTPLHIAAYENKVGAVKLLLERDDQRQHDSLLKKRDNFGKTAFLLAAQKGNIKVLEVFKAHGQDFNETTSRNGWTALHIATDNELLETVKFLLANGAKKWTKIEDGKRKGCTAKDIAEQKKNLELVAAF